MDVRGAEAERDIVWQGKVRAIERLRGRDGDSAGGAAQCRGLSESCLASWERTGNPAGIGLYLKGQGRLARSSVDTGRVDTVEWRVFQRRVGCVVAWEIRYAVAAAQDGVRPDRGREADARSDIGICGVQSGRRRRSNYSGSVGADRL